MTHPVPYPSPHRRGFTLIELSIVLVIIGLIVGGILVGQDLIHAATLKSQITQIDKFKVAVNTFQGKYNALPGDIPATQAAQFGFATRGGGAGQGDGNGLIQEVFYAGPPQMGSGICGETALFWNDLSTAGFIAGGFVGADGNADAGLPCTSASSIAQLHSIVPAGILNGTTVSVYGDNTGGKNYLLVIGNFSTLDVNGRGYNNGVCCNSLPGVTPSDAEYIDNKIDDGQPLSGSLQAVKAGGADNGIIDIIGFPIPATSAAAANNVCVATGNVYNTNSSTGGTSIACSLRFDLQ